MRCEGRAGVRPSPGAATSELPGALDYANACRTPWLAVPEDGHTPGALTALPLRRNHARPQTPSGPPPQRRRRDIFVEPGTNGFPSSVRSGRTSADPIVRPQSLRNCDPKPNGCEERVTLGKRQKIILLTARSAAHCSPVGASENSPAFQRRVQFQTPTSPEGTADRLAINLAKSFMPSPTPRQNPKEATTQSPTVAGNEKRWSNVPQSFPAT
jgi:hypothetical protein